MKSSGIWRKDWLPSRAVAIVLFPAGAHDSIQRCERKPYEASELARTMAKDADGCFHACKVFAPARRACRGPAMPRPPIDITL